MSVPVVSTGATTGAIAAAPGTGTVVGLSRFRCPMQPHLLPRGLRDQLNPNNDNLALNPGGLSIGDLPVASPPRVGIVSQTRRRFIVSQACSAGPNVLHYLCKETAPLLSTRDLYRKVGWLPL